jgi:hypothetical protein
LDLAADAVDLPSYRVKIRFGMCIATNMVGGVD